MRLEGQAKSGFFPADPAAISELCKHLALGPLGDREHHSILDPCAGKGEALAQIAEALGILPVNTYAIELNDVRGKAVRERMPQVPETNILEPCSFHSSYITPGSMSLVYCNPPYDDELGGGGREELSFLGECYRLLAKGGIMVAVIPWRTASHRETKLHLDGHYVDARLLRFPTMKYNEVVYIGVKRSSAKSESESYGGYLSRHVADSYGYRHKMPADLAPLGEPDWQWVDGVQIKREDTIKTWALPGAWRPAKFVKSSYIPGELEKDVADSPLNDCISDPPDPPLLNPPLPLGEGHVCLQMAAGGLNGLIECGAFTHVMKGVASKEEYLNEDACEERESPDGEYVTVKTVYSQKPVIIVRAVGFDGVIHTYKMDGGAAGGERVEEERITENEYKKRLKKRRTG